MHTQEAQLRASLQQDLLNLIQYGYYVTAGLFSVGGFLWVLFHSDDMGSAVLTFFLVVFLYAICWYPKQRLVRGIIPNAIALWKLNTAPQPKYDFQTSSPSFTEEDEEHSPLERGYYPQMSHIH